MARFHLYLVRHGQSAWNADRRIQGQTADVALTPLGEHQAGGVAGVLAACGARTVYSSDLRRALQTALPVAGRLGVPVIAEADLRERSLGLLEGQRSAFAWAAADAGWSNPGGRPPGGESIRDVYARVRRFLSRLQSHADGSPVVVVTHGDTAVILLGLLRGYPDDGIPPVPMANGEIVTVPVPAGLIAN